MRKSGGGGRRKRLDHTIAGGKEKLAVKKLKKQNESPSKEKEPGTRERKQWIHRIIWNKLSIFYTGAWNATKESPVLPTLCCQQSPMNPI